MPAGVYDRKKAAPKGAGSLKGLRDQLLAIGAEQMYRTLTRQLEALRRAYPALNKFDQADSQNGHKPTRSPAPDALELFRARKRQTPATAKTPTSPKHAGTRPSRRSKPGQVTPGTLGAHIVTLLREKGPLSALAVGNELYTAGIWKPKTAVTEQLRTGAISVMLRQFIKDNRKLVKVIGGNGTHASPTLYAAY